ncbi:MAG: UDP-glucose 4-epimerase GalE [Arcanobacterium sp.]|nr:UDP-glucose 4-epimerase GalE [Arcanobacterium sp.]
MAWLVTGGAGYIGSHVVRAFLEAGITPVVFDDFSTGKEEFVPEGVAIVRGTILDTELLIKTMREHDITGVMSIAGYKFAGESVKFPIHTYEQNVVGILSLLKAMQEVGVHKYVFSSSAAVYGTPDVDLVTEDQRLAPESPYGETKLIGEWLARAIANVDPEWQYTCLRYFNVVGSGTDEVYDASPYSLFGITFNRLLEGKTPMIFGDDYPTPDGTCVRDYVHVADLALSHVAAALAMETGKELKTEYNLGSGDGSSVAAILRTVADVTGIAFTPEIVERRAGDPARVVANGDAAAKDLDWRMRNTLNEMVASAWKARQAHQK